MACHPERRRAFCDGVEGSAVCTERKLLALRKESQDPDVSVGMTLANHHNNFNANCT